MILSQNSTADAAANSVALAAGCFGGLQILIETSKQNQADEDSFPAVKKLPRIVTCR